MILLELLENLEDKLSEPDHIFIHEIQEWQELRERVDRVNKGIALYHSDIFQYGEIAELLNSRDWYRIALQSLWTGEK